jgi:hypothetical protein
MVLSGALGRSGRFSSAIWAGRLGAFSAFASDSVDHLQNAITHYIDSHNSGCRPFMWNTSANAIFEKLAQVTAPSV